MILTPEKIDQFLKTEHSASIKDLHPEGAFGLQHQGPILELNTAQLSWTIIQQSQMILDQSCPNKPSEYYLTMRQFSAQLRILYGLIKQAKIATKNTKVDYFELYCLHQAMQIEEKSLQPIYRSYERFPKMSVEQLKEQSFYLRGELTQDQERDHHHTFNDSESLKALVQSTKGILSTQLKYANLITKRPKIECDHVMVDGLDFKIFDQGNFYNKTKRTILFLAQRAMQHKMLSMLACDPQGAHQSVKTSLQHAQKSLEQQCSIGAAYANAQALLDSLGVTLTPDLDRLKGMNKRPLRPHPNELSPRSGKRKWIDPIRSDSLKPVRLKLRGMDSLKPVRLKLRGMESLSGKPMVQDQKERPDAGQSNIGSSSGAIVEAKSEHTQSTLRGATSGFSAQDDQWAARAPIDMHSATKQRDHRKGHRHCARSSMNNSEEASGIKPVGGSTSSLSSYDHIITTTDELTQFLDKYPWPSEALPSSQATASSSLQVKARPSMQNNVLPELSPVDALESICLFL